MSRRLTANDIVRAISRLPKDRVYHYVKEKTTGQIEIVRVDLPEGPIVIKRFDTHKGKPAFTAKNESISSQMIWRIANAVRPGQPFNFDRILGGSYNTRSVLEALMVHTPEFYFCYPGRIEDIGQHSKIREGHKHVLWLPDSPHKPGQMQESKTEIVISEIPNTEVYYDALVVPDELTRPDLDITVQRRHAQIQIALILIGHELGYRSWIAQNDKGIIYKNKKLGEMDEVLSTLSKETVISNFPDAIKAALLIDCIWFRDGKHMPAVIEVEHTTGVTSGLTRMKGLQDAFPSILTRYVIVAPDEDRHKVLAEAGREQFKSLNAKFFPYSSVEELYGLCQRRKLRGITDEFIDAFMEPTIGVPD